MIIINFFQQFDVELGGRTSARTLLKNESKSSSESISTHDFSAGRIKK